MIRLSNGHAFRFIAASGALAYDGRGWPWEQPLRWAGLLNPALFTVVTKTLTYAPRKGNLVWHAPWRCVRFIKDGTVNAVGLTNPGFKWWCGTVGPRANSKKIPLIVSIRSENLAELREMAQALCRYDIVGLQFNASCPNSPEEVMADPQFVKNACAEIKSAAPTMPLSIKLGLTTNLSAIVKGAEEYAEFFDINAVPWSDIFPHTESPLKRYGGGGVSGKIAQPHTWSLFERIRGMTQTPVVAPSIWTYEDLLHLETLGAEAYSFGSLFLRHPTRPTQYARRMMAQSED